MHLARRDWPDVPDMVRRLFETELDKGWLRVEEFQDEGALVVRAEIPGIDPDKDVDISVSDDVLTIRAEREEKTETKEKGSYRSEFRYGSFVRTVPLPAGASKDEVTASYTDGVLEVRIQLREAPPSKSKKVPVTRR